MVKGARKTKLCAYAVAVEGWRRGLTLKWYTIDSGRFDDMITFGVNPPGRLFSLSSKDRTHYFFRTRGDKVANQAVEIGSDKNETKEYLKRYGVAIPEGGKYSSEHTDEYIIEKTNEQGYPVVLKPTDASLGNGVVTNIRSDEQLKKALGYVRGKLGYQNLIVERYVTGEEYRVYVVDDEVIAVYNRLPANVTGDGEKTIRELIDEKNGQRLKNARLFNCLINLDEETLDFIQTAGYTLDSVVPKGEKILLKEKTNVSAGGDPIDVTDEFPEELKALAINSVKAIPNLHHCGVDVIVDINKQPLDPVVIELNPTAQIGGILFPMKGKARDIPKAIVDYYFPETKDIQTEREKIYFDLNAVLEPLVNRSAQEVEVAPALVGKIYRRKFILTGQVNQSRYHRMIKNYAFDHDISGYVYRTGEKEIEIVIATNEPEKIDGFKKMLREQTDFAKVKSMYEDKHEEPVKIGFDVYEELGRSSSKDINTVVKRAEKELNKLKKSYRRLFKEPSKIKASRSWRVTKPIRVLSSKNK